MNFDTQQKLDKLSQQILDRDFAHYQADGAVWEQYDVMIVHRANSDADHWARLPSQTTEYYHAEPRRRLIATRYANELIWLFEQLHAIHPEEIERYGWHDFYAILADAANHYIDVHKGGVTATRLLEEIIKKVRDIYR